MTSKKSKYGALSPSLGAFLTTHAAKSRFPINAPGHGKRFEASHRAAQVTAEQPNGESRQARKRRMMLAEKADFKGKRREA